jgi:hypothetical protein
MPPEDERVMSRRITAAVTAQQVPSNHAALDQRSSAGVERRHG